MEEEQNYDFICDVCGRRDLVPSIVTLKANYGSTHDGEHKRLEVCGDCLDWLFEGLVQEKKLLGCNRPI